jgi:hypothetical protein
MTSTCRVLGCAALPAANAETQTFKGNVDFWLDLDVTVTDGQITHFAGKMGTIPCHDAQGRYVGEGDTYRIDATGPFQIVDGYFHFDSPPTEEDVRGGHTTMTVDGDVRDGSLSGTLGKITQLVAMGSAFCNNDQDWQVELDYYSYANRTDPIPVDGRGRFELDTVGLSTRGATKRVVHVVLKGQIKGSRATGVMTLMGRDSRNVVADCRVSKRWSAQGSGAFAPPAVPSAFYSTEPLRGGHNGAYTYWLRVTIDQCFKAQRAQVSVAGRTRLVRCGSRALFGPLRPKRTYTIVIRAVQMSHGRIKRRGPIHTNGVYLPGDDGLWVPTDDI